MRDFQEDFQEGFLHGPPPLGPGAPAAARLEAFIVELVRLEADHLHIALAAEQPGRDAATVYGTLLIHIAALVHAIDPTLDEQVLAAFILSAIAPPVLYRMQQQLDLDTAALQASARALLQGLTCPDGA